MPWRKKKRCSPLVLIVEPFSPKLARRSTCNRDFHTRTTLRREPRCCGSVDPLHRLGGDVLHLKTGLPSDGRRHTDAEKHPKSLLIDGVSPRRFVPDGNSSIRADEPRRDPDGCRNRQISAADRPCRQAALTTDQYINHQSPMMAHLN
jgi:hypothetical protein